MAFPGFCVSTADAQARAWDVSLSSGVAFPVGLFANTHQTPGQPYADQRAATGWNLDGQATFRFFHGLGITALAGYQFNPFTGPAEGVSNYSTWRVLAGPSYRIPLATNWALTARLLGGVERVSLTSDENQGLPFAWQAGVVLQYSLCKSWYLLASADFITATYHIPYVEYVTPNEIGGGRYDGPRRTIDTDLGIGFRF
jgi:hypothetical protein